MPAAQTRNKRPPRIRIVPNVLLTGLEPRRAAVEYVVPPEPAELAMTAPATTPPIAPPNMGSTLTQPGGLVNSPGASEVALALEAWQLGHARSVSMSCV